jgi:hypothetical protein
MTTFAMYDDGVKPFPWTVTEQTKGQNWQTDKLWKQRFQSREDAQAAIDSYLRCCQVLGEAVEP